MRTGRAAFPAAVHRNCLHGSRNTDVHHAAVRSRVFGRSPTGRDLAFSQTIKGASTVLAWVKNTSWSLKIRTPLVLLLLPAYLDTYQLPPKWPLKEGGASPLATRADTAQPSHIHEIWRNLVRNSEQKLACSPVLSRERSRFINRSDENRRKDGDGCR